MFEFREDDKAEASEYVSDNKQNHSNIFSTEYCFHYQTKPVLRIMYLTVIEKFVVSRDLVLIYVLSLDIGLFNNYSLHKK